MPEHHHWFLDFDETLASGSITWSLEFAIPRLIQTYGLAYDAERFGAATLVAQKRASREDDPLELVAEFFQTMGWPRELVAVLLADVMSNYRPQLFEDVVPFLDRLRAASKCIYVVSNNPTSVASVRLLAIEPYITQVFTPKQLGCAERKPHRGLWDAICALDRGISSDNTVLVGDDPWADGAFADNCQIPCWIVDRGNRFSQMRTGTAYHWVQSLLDIPV